MDACRISLAKVKSQKYKSKVKSISQKLKVLTKPLVSLQDGLGIGELIEKEVWAEGTKDFKEGDLVAIHWDWVCGRLTEYQARDLDKWTNFNLRLVNFDF
jgi:hypothetical protein